MAREGNYELITCPKCKFTSVSTWWDNHTKEDMEIEPTDLYVPIKAPKDLHKDYMVRFSCPVCGERVNGTDLIREGEGR